MNDKYGQQQTRLVPAKGGSGRLFDEELVTNEAPVTCLGMTFVNDEARRAYFTEELRKKLQDPEFCKIEGFPIGSDEDILNLSDPPFYTTCPNPWIADFIAEWEAQKPEQPEGYHYHREPFAADVSEGKNDPIYNAHSYHTKVPHKAIMRYILHYTEPGDIVFDGFCGTGMTGVAGALCGDRGVVKSLGYQVKPDGTILQEETDENGRKVWMEFSVFGKRNAVLNDFSPLASFVASNYNSLSSFDGHAYEIEKLCKTIKRELEHLFYKDVMKGAFSEAYRVLKPSKWITVEFHNSQNSVWMAIQEALWQAGFTVADVRVLDKKQGAYNVVNRSGSVNKDLVISAYKPDFSTENNVKIHAGSEESVWDFVRMHLGQLPAFVSSKDATEIISERQPHLLFDRMVAFHVQRGISVPISAAEFYQGLSNRYPERDGMFFLEEQVAIYDRKKMHTKGIEQLSLFVTDETSAIQWLRQMIKERPQTFQDINPQFLKEIGGWNKNEQPLELSTLLEQNFLRYGGRGPVPEQIHAYLSTNWKELRNLPKDDPALIAKTRDRWYVPDPNKAGDLEKLREKTLLKEFEEYKAAKKKLKVFRLEAVRAGFKKAWQERDYAVIVAVADKIPNNVLEEDPKLLMWYDQAVTRMGGE